jgi:hypothetical protein
VKPWLWRWEWASTVVIVVFSVGSWLWLVSTVPPGAQTQQADGLCYRVEARRVLGLTLGYLYWEVACPPS